MLEIEKSIIGSILIDPKCIYEIYDKVQPEMFESKFCREVYQNCLVMFDKGQAIDDVVLSTTLADENIPAEDIRKQLAICVMDVPTSVHVKEYSEQLIKNYRARELVNILGHVDTNPQNVNDQIATLLTRLEELQQGEKQRSRSLAEMVEAYQYNYFSGKSAEEGIRLGFPNIDDCLKLEGGDVLVIGARPAVGKSAFAINIIEHIAKAGKKIGYFNLEMNDNQVYERFLARESELELTRIRKATNFLGTEQEQFVNANKALKKLNVVVSAGSKTDLDIRAECRHQNFDAIVIDYLQLVRSHKRCENRRVEVGEVSRSLKALAMELNVPVILLSQLSRNSEHTAEKEPTMADLRETGDIEQDASAIILLWNLSNNPNCREYKGLKVEKNRNGELLEENLIFLGKYMKFGENNQATLAEVKKNLKEMEKVYETVGAIPFEEANKPI